VLWTDEVFEMIAVEVKGGNPKCAWEVVGVYRAPNEDMRVIERLAAPTGFTGNSTKHSINGVTFRTQTGMETRVEIHVVELRHL